MKKNIYYLKKTLLLTTIIFMVGCQTGNTNNQISNEEAESGIINIDQMNMPSKTPLTIKKIFSNSAIPGYYLQVGFFQQHKPNRTFIHHLKHSHLHYTILEKSGNHYALVGPYISYNHAKSNASAIKSALKEDTFVIQVLHP